MNLYNSFKKLVPASIRYTTKKVLLKLLVGDETGNLLNEFEYISYSQEGEDRILHMLFGVLNKKNGFYVDVGAHHPLRFSNTCLYYRRGWRGINIDANKDAMLLFQQARPRDINIAMGIAEKAEKQTFYVFDEPALNTFDAGIAHTVAENSPYRIVEEHMVEVKPLSAVLDAYLPQDQEIDFLSIDVEGRDLSVLMSNDWSKYKPSFILIEYHSGFDQKEGFYFDEVLNSEIARYLKDKGYNAFAKTLNTVFFKLKAP